MILNGGLKPHPMIDALVRGLNPTLPIITCEQSTYETGSDRRAHPRPHGQPVGPQDRGVPRADGALHRRPRADGRAGPGDPEVVTPQMFEYQLAARAKADQRHIVLPEGEPRILRAAAQLIARGVARLTLLGDPEQVAAQLADLDLELPGVDIIDPLDRSSPRSSRVSMPNCASTRTSRWTGPAT